MKKLSDLKLELHINGDVDINCCGIDCCEECPIGLLPPCGMSVGEYYTENYGGDCFTKYGYSPCVFFYKKLKKEELLKELELI